MDSQKHTTFPFSEVKHWDITTDVAVVGFGGAGACAAISAADQNANVTIFEAASAPGGSTALSGGDLYLGGSGGTPVQRAAGFTDTTEDMIKYLMAANGPQASQEKIETYCEGALGHYRWLVDLGVPFKKSAVLDRIIMPLTDDCLIFSGSEKAWPFNEQALPAPRGHHVQAKGDNGGQRLMDILTEEANNRGIDIRLDARVLHLITDNKAQVRGLTVRIDGKIFQVKANKGVVLCCGGFAMNESMIKDHAPLLAKCNTPIGNPNDNGSGIQMGISAGGNAINMHEAHVTLPFYPPSSLTYGIFVNAQGQRFINEDAYHGRIGYFTLKEHETSHRIYLIISAEDYPDEHFQSYLNADICATGESIEELEAELEVPQGSLQSTVEAYNHYAKQKSDPSLHKHKDWIKPLLPPFAALDCTPGRGAYFPYFTLGGLETSVQGEALNFNKQKIIGLYAAGRTACGVPRSASGYSSGTSIGDATFSGRLAGYTAANSDDIH